MKEWYNSKIIEEDNIYNDYLKGMEESKIFNLKLNEEEH